MIRFLKAERPTKIHSSQIASGGSEFRLDVLSRFGLVISIAAVLIIFSILSPYFMTIQNMLIIVRQASFLLILGCALTIVLISGGVDLSVGSAMVASSIMCAIMLKDWGKAGIFPAILITLLIGIGLGAFNGYIISRWKINPWLTTLATASLYRGIAFVVPAGHLVSGIPPEFSDFVSSKVLGIPVLGGAAIIVCVLSYVVLTQTAYGRHIRALGSNSEAAKYCGMPVSRYEFYIYVIAGLLAAFAGILVVGRGGSASPGANVGIELYAIAAVVIGGTGFVGGKGSILGTVLGVLFVQSVLNGLIIIRFDTAQLKLANGLLLILAVVIDGIRSRKSR